MEYFYLVLLLIMLTSLVVLIRNGVSTIKAKKAAVAFRSGHKADGDELLRAAYRWAWPFNQDLKRRRTLNGL